MTLNVQFFTMVFMIISGFYLGIALETFRRFSSLWRHRPVLVYVLEVSFWLIQTFIIFYILYKVNAGELRVYIFLACCLGFAMYQVLAATLYQAALEHVIRLFIVIGGVIKRLCQVLIFSPIGWVFRMLLSVVWLVLWVLLHMLFMIMLPFKWLAQLIYYLLPENIKKVFNKKVDFYSILKVKLLKWVNSIMGR